MLSVVCLFVRLRSFETFGFCFRTTGPISTKHTTKHITLMCRGFMLIKNKGSHLLLKCKILLVSFRILLSKIQSARKASMYVEAYSGSVHLSLLKVWSPWVEWGPQKRSNFYLLIYRKQIFKKLLLKNLRPKKGVGWDIDREYRLIEWNSEACGSSQRLYK